MINIELQEAVGKLALVQPLTGEDLVYNLNFNQMVTNQTGVEFNTPFTIFEKRPVPYYVPDLPKDLVREELIGMARRAIANDFDLTIIPLDYYKVMKKALTEEEAITKGYESKTEYLRKLRKNCFREGERITHAAKYQRKILDKEYGGRFPKQNSN